MGQRVLRRPPHACRSRSTVADLNMDMIGRNSRADCRRPVIGKEHSSLGAVANRVTRRATRSCGCAHRRHPAAGRTCYFAVRPLQLRAQGRAGPLLLQRDSTPTTTAPPTRWSRIDAEKAARIVRMVFYVGLDVANATSRPQWNADSTSGSCRRGAVADRDQGLADRDIFSAPAPSTLSAGRAAPGYCAVPPALGGGPHGTGFAHRSRSWRRSVGARWPHGRAELSRATDAGDCRRPRPSPPACARRVAGSPTIRCAAASTPSAELDEAAACAVAATSRAWACRLPAQPPRFLQTWHAPGGPAPNVVAVLEGSDPGLRSEYVVFVAHMDHIGATPGGRCTAATATPSATAPTTTPPARRRCWSWREALRGHATRARAARCSSSSSRARSTGCWGTTPTWPPPPCRSPRHRRGLQLRHDQPQCAGLRASGAGWTARRSATGGWRSWPRTRRSACAQSPWDPYGRVGPRPVLAAAASRC